MSTWVRATLRCRPVDAELQRAACSLPVAERGEQLPAAPRRAGPPRAKGGGQETRGHTTTAATSLMVTTNLLLESWSELSGSERLTGATLDGLIHR